MIVIPFIWFLILTIYLYIKDGISPSAYISVLFTITSGCSVIMAHNNMIEPSAYECITILPTLIYCFLISLAILPVHEYSYKKISIKYNDKIFDYITYFYFAYFLFIIIFLREDLIIRTAAANIVDLKHDMYKGFVFDPKKSVGVFWPIMSMFLLLGGCPFIMFPIFFISIIKGRKKWWYYMMAFLGTTPVVLMGMLNIDRSSTFKWLVFLGFNIALFWNFMSKSIKKKIIPIIAGVFIVIASYMTVSTISRFKDGDSGAVGGFIEYAGQPYPNFCHFFTEFDNHEGLNTKYLLPFIHHYIIQDYESNTDRQEELTVKSGLTCGVFYTFLGTFILDCNQAGPFLFMMLYGIFAYICISNRRKVKYLPVSDFLCSYALFLIPTFGCISYLYADPGASSCTILVLIAIYFYTNEYGYNSVISNVKKNTIRSRFFKRRRV